ncbi:MAG: hypothetical protein JWO43_453 [Candidatus Adlerbacteria bacterium]|nr:hypothetical protein [Candidatus Adlerbacteria bacterium]
MPEEFTVGFIGQGFIGKNYADDFVSRGFSVVRYALESEYAGNKEAIAECDPVFIAVPTPTTPTGFDDSILRAVLPLVGVGKTAVIKSTTLPGTIDALQKSFPDRVILHSPEFLAEKTAAYDAAHPTRNIIGIPAEHPEYRAQAEVVLSMLPKAPFKSIIEARESELIKYASNTFLLMKVLFSNLIYDATAALGGSYEHVRAGLAADPRIGPSHLGVLDVSGHLGAKLGRGAGGHCFIKDLAAFAEVYKQLMPSDPEGLALLNALEKKNISLLTNSGKDIDLLEGVYGSGLTHK